MRIIKIILLLNLSLISSFSNLKNINLKNINLKNNNIKLNLDNNFTNYINNRDKKDKELLKNVNKELKLLNNITTIYWGNKWLYDMFNELSIEFPTFMYGDIFIMREYCKNNFDINDLYIGYYPKDENSRYGPHYICAFKIIKHKRMISAKMIIKNPNYYYLEEKENQKIFLNFKHIISNLSLNLYCQFNFNDLKNNTNKRYWMTWYYNI